MIGYYVCDVWLEKKYPKPTVILAICVVFFIVELPLISDAGIYIVELLDSNVTSTSVFFSGIAYCYICEHYYTIEALKETIFEITLSIHPEFVWKCIEKICPFIFLCLLILNISGKIFNPKYYSMYDALWPYLFEIILNLGPFVVFGYFYMKYGMAIKEESYAERNRELLEREMDTFSNY